MMKRFLPNKLRAFNRRLFLQKSFIIGSECEIRLKVVSVSPANRKFARCLRNGVNNENINRGEEINE